MYAFTPHQTREIARFLEMAREEKEELDLYKTLFIDMVKVDSLSNQEIAKLDSITIAIDMKYGLVQKEYWKMLEQNEELSKKLKETEKEKNSIKSSRNKWRIIGVLSTALAGVFVYKSLK